MPVDNDFAEGESEKVDGWGALATCAPGDLWATSMRPQPAPRLAVLPDRGRSYVRAHVDVDCVVVGIGADTPSCEGGGLGCRGDGDAALPVCFLENAPRRAPANSRCQRQITLAQINGRCAARRK